MQTKRQQHHRYQTASVRNHPRLSIIWPKPLIPMAKIGQTNGITRPTRPITSEEMIGTKRVPPKNASASGRRILWNRSCSIQTIYGRSPHRGSRCRSTGSQECSGCYWLSEPRRLWLAECLYRLTRSLPRGSLPHNRRSQRMPGYAFVFARRGPSGMAIQNMTGRKLKANEPILLIQVR